MKRTIIFIVLILNILSVKAQMENTYFTWEQYSENWRTELLNAVELYENIEKGKFPEYGLNYLDFTFKSDKKENLENLSNRLSEIFNCSSLKIEKNSGIYELNGNTEKFPITKDNIIFWELTFYKEGYQFDPKLAGYGAYSDNDKVEFLDYSAENENVYYKKAVKLYENQNLFGAIVNWNNTIKVNPNDYYSYYDLGFAKNELNMFKDAMKDFEKSIEINPKFYSGIVARGTLSDENAEFDIAIEYYNKAINLEPENPQAYFNKGNTYFNKKELKKACEIWTKAKELGAEYAQERIDKECGK